MVTRSQYLFLYGAEQPPASPLPLRAGPLTLLHEQGLLRSIAFGSHELIRAIYAAVRDQNWNTIEPRFTAYRLEQADDHFLIQFTAEHVSPAVDFFWHGVVRGENDGTISYSFSGEARRSFLKNRIGFCVLHPPSLAGLAVEMETPQGPKPGHFPERIAPHQPFLDLQALRHAVPGLPGLQLELRFEGDLFETEDQRNWTDASFKTYCTPLALPFPVEIKAGQRIEQHVEIRLIGERSSGLAIVQEALNSAVATPELRVGRASGTTLPALGLACAPEATTLSSGELERLAALRLSHLWLELNLLTSTWRRDLLAAMGQAQALSLPLELSLVCGDNGEGLDDLVAALGELRPPLTRLFCFSCTTHTTTSQIAECARSRLQAAGITLPLGGGSRANFAEFNRAQLPLGLLDVAGYPITPQVHAFDQRTLIENLGAQAETVRSARAIVGSLPLSIGPLTLKPRFNAVATTPPGPPEPGRLPDNVDRRQCSLFAAGWTLGSISQLAMSGIDWLTCYETVGWRGVMERPQPSYGDAPFPHLPGALFPIYHLFADLGEFSGAELLTVEGLDPLTCTALALRQDRRLLLLIANLSTSRQVLHLQLPPLRRQRLRLLDETNAEEALFAGEAFRRRSRALSAAEAGTLELRPCAFARLDGELEEEPC
jgi:hypothetical protein